MEKLKIRGTSPTYYGEVNDFGDAEFYGFGSDFEQRKGIARRIAERN